MKQVKVYGPGCKRCETLVSMVEEAASQAGIEVSIEKVTDYAEIAKAGIAATPGLAIDGKLVHTGGLPKPGSINAWLSA